MRIAKLQHGEYRTPDAIGACVDHVVRLTLGPEERTAALESSSTHTVH